MASLANSATASLESLESGNYSFYTARSLFPSLETPTETDSPRSENVYNSRRSIGSPSSLACFPESRPASSESLESGNSNLYMTHVTARKSGTSADTDSQRFDNRRGLQTLIKRSPRIIAVMGPTGAGKSTFIKAATGVDDVRIGHGLRSCTEEVRAVHCQHPFNDSDIVLVDTPGFDDTFKSDAQILEQIANWLRDTYQAGVKLSGILYLHRITDNRITNTVIRNLDMFQKLCGSDTLSSIILVTTSWGLLHAENIHEGKANEEQLCTKYWKPLLSSGSKTLRFDNTCSSAWIIIDSLPETTISLNIQREMVERGIRLSDTAAGRSLSSWLQWASQIFQNMIQRLEALLRGDVDSSDHDHPGAKRYEENLRQINQGLKAVHEQEKRLSRSGSLASSVVRKLKTRKKKNAPA